VPAPGEGFVRDADVEGNGEHRKFLQVFFYLFCIACGVRRRRGTRKEDIGPERAAHAEHRLRHVHLVGVQRARQAFEVAQHLEAGDAQAARLDRRHRRGLAAGMADDVGSVEHDLLEPGLAHRLQLGLERPGQGDGVHPEVIEIHDLTWLTTSSNVTPPR
jgi:hypothetical protein